jgi:competence ComEA-like helix-hairpin-helix protein
MSRSRDVLIAVLVVGSVCLAVQGARPPPALGRAGPALVCAIPVENAGEGVVCLTAAMAHERRIVAGDRMGARPAGHERMAPDRLAAWGVAVDVNRATVEELASLDGIGVKLAARIVAGRPYVTIDDVARIKGIGVGRLARLRDRLVLDE